MPSITNDNVKDRLTKKLSKWQTKQPQHHLSPDTPREWLRRCDAEHGDHCTPDPWTSASGKGPKRLIDVGQRRIVIAPSGAQYAALSYVWGDTNSYLLGKGTHSLLEEPGAVTKVAPKTISDAIYFTHRYLEIAYLWVDALCIMQDDDTEKQTQVYAMDAIFANAYVTLVAASAPHANVGLKWGPSSSTECCSIASVAPESQAKTRHEALLRDSRWNRRGWTLQESIFSHRVIFFHDKVLTWQCHCVVWHSCDPPRSRLLATDCKVRSPIHANGLQLPWWPDIDRLRLMVQAYNKRQLTFDNDIQAAFIGIINALSQVFPGRFIFGLPEMFFDVAILWQSNESRLERRSGPFPSWSWIGWKNNFCFEAWKLGRDYLAGHPAMSVTTNVAEWKIKTSEDSGWSLLLVSRADHRHLAGMAKNDATEALQLPHSPKGWTALDMGTNTWFQYQSDVTTRFRYPIPLRTRTEPATPAVSPSVLSITTKRAFLRLQFNEPLRQDLFDAANKQIGSMRLDQRPDTSPLGFTTEHEFIAVSVTHCRSLAGMSGLLSLWEQDILKHQGQYSFYNVMCIRRNDDGSACRRGVGRVIKEDWDFNAEKGKIEVRLK